MNNNDIKKMLRNDVKWASKNGFKINMATFGTTEENGRWVAERRGCGLCAIGSNLVRNNSKAMDCSSTNSFQRLIRRSDSYVSGLVDGTSPEFSRQDAILESDWYDSNSHRKAYLDGFKTGREVLDWVKEQKKLGNLQ